jgi:hypothetical protein
MRGLHMERLKTTATQGKVLRLNKLSNLLCKMFDVYLVGCYPFRPKVGDAGDVCNGLRQAVIYDGNSNRLLERAS